MTGNKSEHHCCLGGMRVCKTLARAYHFISKNGTIYVQVVSCAGAKYTHRVKTIIDNSSYQYHFLK